MPRRTKEEAEQTRQQLLDTALVLFAQQGISRTSLKEIAASAGVTHGALYWHFKNRADLVAGLYQECRFPIDDLYINQLQSARQNALEALEDFLTQWCLLILNEGRAGEIWRVFHQAQEADPELVTIADQLQDEHLEWLEYLSRFIKQGRKQNLIADKSAKKDPLPAATLALVLGIITSIDVLNIEKKKQSNHIRQTVRAFLFGVGQYYSSASLK